MSKSKKIQKKKKVLRDSVYTMFSTGAAYAFWQFFSTPRTLQFMEQRRMYALEGWVIAGLLVIFILVNLHLELEAEKKAK